MKISSNNSSVNLDAYINNKQADNLKKNEPPDEKTSVKTEQTDTVSLSSKTIVQKAREQLDSVPDVDEEKIAQAKTDIENGTYQVDGEKIAFKMIEESLLNQWL